MNPKREKLRKRGKGSPVSSTLSSHREIPNAAPRWYHAHWRGAPGGPANHGYDGDGICKALN